jgi:bifunctional non-homologous end joining protein LigD
MVVSEPLPRFIAPMLLASTATVPETPEWTLEVKWDGMRAQVRVDGRRVTVRSRPGRDCTAQFPELRGLVDALHSSALLDGELVCFDTEGRPDFERLRGRLRARTAEAVAGAQSEAPACLLIFDVLHFAGQASRARPYRERRRVLDELALEGPAWRTPRAFDIGDDLVAVTRAYGLEGVVAKRLDAPYQPGYFEYFASSARWRSDATAKAAAQRIGGAVGARQGQRQKGEASSAER